MTTPAAHVASPPSGTDPTQTLLTRFAVALNRRRAYKASHPMVQSSERLLLATIGAVTKSQAELVLGIEARELLWDGKRIRTRISVVREVAARLHRRGVSAITFQQGITLEGLSFLLGWLSGDAAVIAEARKQSESGTPQVPGFVIGRIPYDQLVLADSAQSNEAQVNSVWSAMGSVALPNKQAARVAEQASGIQHDTHLADAAEIVAAIRAGADNDSYVRNVARVMFTLVDQATHATPQQRAAIGERLRDVMPLLDVPSVVAILRHIGTPEQQRQFVAHVAEMLPLNAVVDWLEVASRAGKRDLSHQLLRIMRKLGALSHESMGAAPESGFREATLELVSGWNIDDPNPGEHIELLDQIALIESDRAPRPDAAAATELTNERQTEPARLVQMALELDEVSEDAREAVTQLVQGSRAPELLQWIDQTPNATSGAQLLAYAAAPEVLRVMLARTSPDMSVVRALLAAAEPPAIPALFDVLSVSPVRLIRRLVLDRLRQFGPLVWTELLTRLDDTRWYVVRNLLSLMREIRSAVKQSGGDLTKLPLTGVPRYLSHAREQVRIETVRLLVEDPALRDGALRRALDDANPRLVREGVEWIVAQSDAQPAGTIAIQSGELFTHLLKLVGNAQLPDEVRARAVWALESQRTPATLDWLIAHVTRRRLITRRVTLAESQPTVLAALGLLAKRYASDKQAQAVLAMARATNDLRGHAAQGGNVNIEATQ